MTLFTIEAIAQDVAEALSAYELDFVKEPQNGLYLYGQVNPFIQHRYGLLTDSPLTEAHRQCHPDAPTPEDVSRAVIDRVMELMA